MSIECTKQCKYSNQNNLATKKYIQKLNDSKFVKRFININPLLIKYVRVRMPNYTFKRFTNACDVQKAFKHDDLIKTEQVLNTQLDQEALTQLKFGLPVKSPTLKKLFKTTEERILKSSDNETEKCDLSLCSLWLSKDEPLSVKYVTKNPLSGKIYASIFANHSIKDKFVFVQETKTSIGYAYPSFVAKATVAFPPINKGEVWTIGWIQALTNLDQKNEMKGGCDQYLT